MTEQTNNLPHLPGSVEQLIKRLRTGADFHESEGDLGLPHILREAADAIARLAHQPASDVREALRAALDHYERNICTHEETHRGGAIWTICDACGWKWADDEGGFVPYRQPEEITAAYNVLAALRDPAPDAGWQGIASAPKDVHAVILDEVERAVAIVAAEAIRSAFFTSVSGEKPHRYHLSLAYPTMEAMHAAEDAIKAWAKSVLEGSPAAPAAVDDAK